MSFLKIKCANNIDEVSRRCSSRVCYSAFCFLERLERVLGDRGGEGSDVPLVVAEDNRALLRLGERGASRVVAAEGAVDLDFESEVEWRPLVSWPFVLL